MKQKPSLNTFQIAFAYIGTVVGAGFASGQEVLQFFTAYGLWGVLGMLISSLLFFFVGYSVLMMGRGLGAHSHLEVVRFTNGALLGSLIDIVITLFMFGGLAAMLAGAGAIFKEQFALSPVWGILAMAVVTLVTVVTGTHGVVNAISFVVPFLLVSVLYISVWNLMNNSVTQADIETAAALPGATPSWLLSAVNYASYNIVISVGILTPMGAATANRRTLLGGALFGSLGLAISLAAIYLGMLTDITRVRDMEVPMIEVAGQISAAARTVFAIVLFSEVYTTAVGNLFGLVQRISFRLPKWVFALCATGLAFAVAQLGFSNMVKYLYPAVGYGGMLFFVGVAYVWIKKRQAFTGRKTENDR